jgi:hypothetical protein
MPQFLFMQPLSLFLFASAIRYLSRTLSEIIARDSRDSRESACVERLMKRRTESNISQVTGRPLLRASTSVLRRVFAWINLCSDSSCTVIPYRFLRFARSGSWCAALAFVSIMQRLMFNGFIVDLLIGVECAVVASTHRHNASRQTSRTGWDHYHSMRATDAVPLNRACIAIATFLSKFLPTTSQLPLSSPTFRRLGTLSCFVHA